MLGYPFAWYVVAFISTLTTQPPSLFGLNMNEAQMYKELDRMDNLYIRRTSPTHIDNIIHNNFLDEIMVKNQESNK